MEFDNPTSGHENDLSALERRLAAWSPAAHGLDRDRMLYSAGQAAARADDRGRLWRLATAASVVVAVTLGGLLAHERSRRRALESQTIARNDRHDPRPSTPASLPMPTIEAPGPSSYLALASRLAQGDRDLSTLDVEVESRPRGPAPASSKSSPSLEPLRSTDLERVFDL
jgi:hypothetical protein